MGGSTRTYFEMLLVKIASSKQHISYAAIWQKLQKVENLLQQALKSQASLNTATTDVSSSKQEPLTAQKTASVDLTVENSISSSEVGAENLPNAAVSNLTTHQERAAEKSQKKAGDLAPFADRSIPEDKPVLAPSPSHKKNLTNTNLHQHRCDTLLQFAAVEFSAQIDSRTIDTLQDAN